MSPNPKAQFILREQLGFVALQHIRNGLSVAEAGVAMMGAASIIIATLPEASRAEVCSMLAGALKSHVEARAKEMRK